MQSAVPVAPPTAAPSSLPPSIPIAGKLFADFADALTKLLAAPVPNDQTVSPADAAQAEDPGQAASPSQTTPGAQTALPLPMLQQAMATQSPPPTTSPASHDAAPSKTQRQSASPRRGSNACPAQIAPAAAQATPTTSSQPCPDTANVPKDVPEPAQAAIPPQIADALANADRARPMSTLPVAPGPKEPSSTHVDAPAPSQDPPPAAPAEPATAPTAELTARLVTSVPEPAAQPVARADPVAASSPASPAPHTPSPAAQITPALVQIGHASDGTQRLTLRLDPPELGHVQVRIDRPPEAPARVDITVEKPETLDLLLHDQPQLQHALTQAGVPAEGRSVTFHVASPEPTPRSEPATAPAPGVAAGGPSGEGSHGASRQGGQQRPPAGAADGDESEFAPLAMPVWLRSGLDITA